MSILAETCPPVLACDEARVLETRLFAHDESREWVAMQAAGRAIAAEVLRDFGEAGGFPATGRILILIGKGHNGGDALIAANAILARFPNATAEIAFVFGDRALRPLAARAWRELLHGGGPQRVGRAPALGGDSEAGQKATAVPNYDLCLDGIFGFQFRPPADSRVVSLIEAVNALPIRLRAAVDLPSADLFRADFTYATGSVKTPLLTSKNAGRIRYLDLGFFDAAGVADLGPGSPSPATIVDRVLTSDLLSPLRGLRSPHADKRSFGHVFLMGGSRGYPGAIFMATLAAVRSGAGLVTSFVPESLAAAFAAQLPEAIWVGWPETPNGSLALEGEHLLRERIERADVLVVGPGIGREKETTALATQIVKTADVPLVIDADALQREIVTAGIAPRIATPHAGEFKRIAGDDDLRTFARQPNLTVVLKGPTTRISDGGSVYHSFFGGPALARGGSGDLLAGMIGAQLAQTPTDVLGAAARAVVWHGMAADRLARAHGQVAIRTTELLDFLGAVLSGGG